jgi:hypothetical protein
MSADHSMFVMRDAPAAVAPLPPLPEQAVCAWCKSRYRRATGFGVFCSKACFAAEAQEGTGMDLRSRDEVEAEHVADAIAGRTALTDTLILSILKAQTARLERLEKKVAGLEGREVV